MSNLRRILAITAILTLPLFVGCEDDYDDNDHVPPAGLGALIVDNNGTYNTDVYIDGGFQREVKDGDSGTFDIAPGLHRVVLIEDNTDRSFGGDVDVLEGRNTIIEISTDTVGQDQLNVNVYID